MGRNRRRLRNALEFERKFKLQQVGRVAGFTAVYVGMSTLVLGFFYAQLLHPRLAGDPFSALRPDAWLELWRELPELRRLLGLWGVGMLGLSTLFAAALGLHFGHIMAGPLYRLKSELDRIERGEPVRAIRLRDGDAFQDVASSLNRAIESLRLRDAAREGEAAELESLRADREALARALSTFDPKGLCAEDEDRVAALLAALRAHLEKSAPTAPAPAAEPAP